MIDTPAIGTITLEMIKYSIQKLTNLMQKLTNLMQVLKELEQQVEQRSPRKKGRRLREDCAVVEDFGSDELNR